MILHVYVAVSVQSLAPGQTICAHTGTGEATGWEATTIPKVLLTVDEVRHSLDGYEVFAHRLGSTSNRRLRLAFANGYDTVLCEPSEMGGHKLLDALRGDVLHATLGRSGRLVGWAAAGEEAVEDRPISTDEQVAADEAVTSLGERGEPGVAFGVGLAATDA